MAIVLNAALKAFGGIAVKYDKQQQAFIRRFLPYINFARLNDDDWCEIEEKVGMYYTECCMENAEDKQDDIRLCEEILDALP